MACEAQKVQVEAWGRAKAGKAGELAHKGLKMWDELGV
jgi:hypothetical protein